MIRDDNVKGGKSTVMVMMMVTVKESSIKSSVDRDHFQM